MNLIKGGQKSLSHREENSEDSKLVTWKQTASSPNKHNNLHWMLVKDANSKKAGKACYRKAQASEFCIEEERWCSIKDIL